MELKEAIKKCHVRSAIIRESKPRKKYYKNHTIPIVDRVPIEDLNATDWTEYDPREDDTCSLSSFND